MKFGVFATLALLIVPADPAGWKRLAFADIDANRVEIDRTAIVLSIDRSASPLVRVFADTIAVRRLEVTGTVDGNLDIPVDRLWDRGFDDAFLRVGLIESGDRKLNAVQQAVAPEWLKESSRLLGATGLGINVIHCGLLMPGREGWKGKSRSIGPGGLFRERISASPAENGRFRLVLEFDKPVLAAGIWLSADGDDTGAKFRVTVDRLALE